MSSIEIEAAAMLRMQDLHWAVQQVADKERTLACAPLGDVRPSLHPGYPAGFP
ncbi:MAG TPA: hypothetical protein VF285_04600 [Castellaniella sp.]|uniref:hypothetical protein n=1 Tax=Castellaniella sp. TaxID=1955812 RepID=UPI002F121D40